MFHLVIEKLTTSCSFVLAGADLPLIVSSGDRKRKKRPISSALEPASVQSAEFLLRDKVFLPVANQGNVIITVRDKKGISIQFLVECVMKVWMAEKELRCLEPS